MSDNIYSTLEVAAMFGVRPRSVRDWHKKYNVGQLLAHDLYFTDSEVQYLLQIKGKRRKGAA